MFAVISGVALPILSLHAQSPLVITEFLAVNDGALADEDGQPNDWIEIYNPSSAAVDLTGWFLTDNAGQLAKWQFPQTNLAAYTYLVVFASGKDRTNAGTPLHTNFRLDAGGEFLALVQPDGTNVVFAYAPRYPNQRAFTTYGLGMLAGPIEELVPLGATVRALVPAGDLGLAWTTAGYDDSAWASGVTGVGFDTGTNYDGAIGLDLEAQMLNVNPSAYLRVPFTVSDPAQYQELKLRLNYDDGFIAYLNGVEILRTNAPAGASWDSAATGMHGSEAGVAGSLAADFDTATPAYTSSHFEGTTGQTTGPATVQTGDSGSTGRFLRLIGDGVLYQGNAVAFARTAAGRFPRIIADFDFRMVNTLNGDPADGFAFMLIPTSAYGVSGTGAFAAFAGVEEPNYAGVFAVGFDVYPHASQNDVSVHWNGVEQLNVTIPRSTIELVAGQFHHCQALIEYAPDGSGAYVTVVITPNVNPTPGTPLTAINRIFIPGFTNYDCRVEFAGRTGGLDMSVDLDNIDVRFGYPQGLVAAEEFEVSSALTQLQAGDNVLAIHGLNAAADSGDFLILPQLLGRAVTVQTASPFYFAEPTPGDINATGEAAIAPVAQFSVPGGVYTNDLSVALTSSIPGAVIRYTLNGSPPTEASTEYSAPIAVNNSVMISARVYAPGYLPSSLASQSYSLLDANAARFTSNLPLLIIDTYGQVLQQDMEPRATTAVTVIDKPKLADRVSLLDRPDYRGRAGVEGRGQTSWGFPKKPMNIELRDDNDLDVEVSLLGMPAESDWVLLNPYSDKTFMNNFLAFEMHEQMGHYAVRRRFVEVFLNGQWAGGTADTSGKVGTNDYVGLYVLLERIKIDNDRVDITRLNPEDNTEPNITGGYMWKKDKNSPGDVNFALPFQPINAGDAMKFHDPPGAELTPLQRTWLINYLTEFENVFYGPNWRDPATGYTQYIDVDSFVDNHWIVEFTKQIDGYRLSNFMYKDRGGKIKMEPIWDWNLSLGNANYLEGGLTNGWYYPLISAQQHIWLRRLIAEPGDPEFNQAIIDRWGDLRQGVFNVTNVLARVTAITNSIYEAALRDHARWPRLSAYVWPNPDGLNLVAAATDGTDLTWHVNYATPGSYANLIGEMKKWIAGRFAWIDSLYLKAPTLSRSGGIVAAPLSMSAPVGTIYYTRDGSDPRLSGGRISPNAQVYAGDIMLSATTRIIARVYHTNAWSPPARASFGDPIPALAVTELMYHPVGDGTGNFHDEDFEYLEFTNTGTNDLDLTGLRVSGGIDFTFGPGPLELTGTATTNDFEVSGTPYTASQLGAGTGAAVTSGGPAGSFLRLISSGTGVNRNRIAFDQTAAGPYDILTADVDFRANNVGAPPSVGTPTLQDFDTAGTPYAIVPASGANIPEVRAAEAGSTGSFMRITPQVNSLVSAVYFNQSAVGTFNKVIMTLDFRIAGGADGMGVAFLNTATHGTTGVSPAINAGFGEAPNFANALGVGLDVYNNGPNAAEPNANHVSIHWNGAQVSATAAIPTLSLAAGRFHRAQITIDFVTTPSTRALVTVVITPDVNGAGGTPETLFNQFAINGVTAFNGRLAVGARTGGQNANHDIDNVSIQYVNNLAAPGGLSLVLLPGASFGTTGAGTTTNDYVDLPNLADGFALDLAMHNVSFINDCAVHWNGAARGSALVPPASLDFDNGVFHHAHLEIVRAEEGSLVSVSLTPDIFGTPGAPINVFSDLFVAGYYPEDARVEFAGRSGGMDLGLDVENVAVTYAQYAPNLLAPGESVLLVSSNAAFQARYGTALRVAGEYTGHLDNAGERVRLWGPWGEPILNFTYNDAWYPLTDGNGFSLVFPNPQLGAGAWNDAANWRVSSAAGGSPGAADPPPPVLGPVLVSEVLAHSELPETDAVELYNPSATAADIGDWYLTDDFNTPHKYRLPAGTIIPAGGFHLIYESDFNAVPGSPASFGLRAEGDDVYLFSANAAGELTGYYHGFDFGPSAANTSFGRHVISTGDEHFVAQAALTLGTDNAGPQVGPVIISEVMYRPPDDPGAVDNQEHEFIELHNLTADPLMLFEVATNNGQFFTNGWRLRDAVDFQFSLDTLLPAQGYLLVVSFDPVADPGVLADFRAAYGLAPGVPIVGPYSGKLDNSADSVELAKPGDLDPDTLQPDYLLADKVRYADQLPWPAAADGLGWSLHRVQVAEYGNDPANWVAAQPGPGQPFAGGSAPAITGHPQDVTVAEFAPATFEVTVEGGGPFAYQWRHNGVALPEATNASLVLDPVLFAHAGDYSVVVSAGAIAAVSSNAVLTVYPAPIIVMPPETQSVLPGANVNFSVTAIGNGALTYQWRRNGQDLAGATGTSLAVNNAQFDVNDGYYSVVVTDAIGARESDPARLIVRVRPTVTQQLQISPGTNVLEGRTFSFTIGASGTFPMGFRFRAPSDPYFAIPIGNSNHNVITLVVENAKPALHAGNWDVGITNAGGQALSARIVVNVLPAPPFFALHPAHQATHAGATVTLASEARGTDPISYQWYFNDATALPDATNAALVLSSVSGAQAGDYVVVASNHLGMATSEVAQVTLGAGPAITQHPASQSANLCGTALFEVIAEGGSLSYQWYFNGSPLIGATSPTLTLQNLQPAQAGDYRVAVGDGSTSLTSTVATLTFSLGDGDGDGMADAYELAYGLNPCDPADRDLDADNDGRTNWEEAVSGTDPTSAGSVLQVSLQNAGGGMARIQFQAMPDVSYSILYRADPAAGEWTKLADVSAQGATHTVDITDPEAGASGGRFYRVVTPSQP